MSITGFNRRRRELAKIEALNKDAIDETIEEIFNEETVDETMEEYKIDYSKLKVDELRDIAKEKGIDGYLDMKKLELIESIEKVEV